MSNGTTELDRPIPLYMQVVRQLRAQIASGELRDGDRLPSQREMMARWHISMQTASKVIGAMKTEGIAIPSVGRDTLVAPGAAARIAAAAQGASHIPASSLPPAPGGAVIAVRAGKAAAPAPSRRDPRHPLRPPRPAPHRNPRRRRPGRQHHRFLVSPGHRRPGAPARRRPAAARRSTGLHRRGHREPRGPGRRGPCRWSGRGGRSRRARGCVRLACPAHSLPALHRRRQAHRVRRNHHRRRALAQPHLHHHRKLTQAAAGMLFAVGICEVAPPIFPGTSRGSTSGNRSRGGDCPGSGWPSGAELAGLVRRAVVSRWRPDDVGSRVVVEEHRHLPVCA